MGVRAAGQSQGKGLSKSTVVVEPRASGVQDAMQPRGTGMRSLSSIEVMQVAGNGRATGPGYSTPCGDAIGWGFIGGAIAGFFGGGPVGMVGGAIGGALAGGGGAGCFNYPRALR